MISHARLAPAATAFASELAIVLGADRVAVGFVEDHFVQVVALSHGLAGREGSQELRVMGAAMDEAVEQRATVALPARAEDLPRIVLAHDELLRQHGGAACSIPLVAAGEVVGAVQLEYRKPSDMSPARIVACEHVVGLIGPVLYFMRRNERPWRKRLGERIRRAWRHLWGAEGGRLRVIAAVSSLVLIGLLVLPVEYRVGGSARVEGAIQRVLVAPTDGFLRQSRVRPGDLVKAGEVLAELAEQDLQLERNKWASELAQHENAYSAAMARSDRTQLVINRAKADEARAQLELVDEQLGRTRIEAPFDGVIIKGDLTQALGAPVQRGDVLLTIAPRDRYRVIVEVDERDIARVQVGQAGSLALSALPWDALPIAVSRITPMSSAVEGHNVFEVEASLPNLPEHLRPGLQGVAKISVGREPLLWNWSHRAVEWARLGLWGWWGG